MKQALFILAAVLSYFSGWSQNLDVDMKRDWYAEVPTIDINMLDTITLFPVHGNISSAKDVFVWHYQNKNDYTLEVRDNMQPQLSGSYEYTPEKWKLKGGDGDALYLVMKDHKDPQPVHRSLGEYLLVPYRDNYNLLYKVVMVRVYSRRSPQHVDAPSTMN